MQKNNPLYITIMEVIKEKIINGEYKLGDYIPTETELEKEFEVSKITVRKAIELLEGEGYVAKKSGKGTTVISNNIINKLSKAESFSGILTREGLNLKKENTSFEQIEINKENELYSYFGKDVLKVTRTYKLDGIPYIYFVHYLPGCIELNNEEEDNEISLYKLLYKNNIYIQGFHDEFFIDYPSEEVIKALDIDNNPLLGRKRITKDMNNKVVEISIAKYNTKVHNYVVKYNV